MIDNGANIAGDVDADRPAGIGIAGGSIGGDVRIAGLSGPGPRFGGDSYICAASIGGDLQVRHGAQGAGALVIGDAPDCTGTVSVAVTPPGNSVGGDLQVQDNAGAVDVSNSTVTGDMRVQNNGGGTTVSDNSVGGDAQCKHNVLPRNGGGNTARGENQGCPTTGITGILAAVCNAGAGTELRSVEGAGFLPNTQMAFTVTVDGTPESTGLNDSPFVFTDATGAFDSSNPPFRGFTIPVGKAGVMVHITATDGVTTSTYDRSIAALCSS